MGSSWRCYGYGLFRFVETTEANPPMPRFILLTAIIPIVLCMLVLGSREAAGQTHMWSQSFGGTSVDAGLRVSIDGSGNIFVTGRFGDTVDFGGGGLTSAGLNDIFLVKYDASGTHLWSQRFGDTRDDTGLGVSVDGSGNVFVTGLFNGTVDFGGGGLTSTLSSEDIFLAKYDAGGTHLWSQRFGDVEDDLGLSVSVDGSGNVFVTGRFAGTVNFGGGFLFAAGFSDDIFLAKFDASGTHLWSQRFGDTSTDTGESVSVDGSGNVFVTGNFQKTVDFGGGNLISAGFDIFLAKYDASGTHLWSKQFGDTLADTGLGVTVDGSGNVFVTGLFRGTVDFGGGPLTGAGPPDIFLAKYDAGGAHVWSKRFGATGADQGWSVSADGSGNVVATGRFVGTVDFGGGPLTSAGSEDIFLAKYDAGGAHVWSKRFGGTSADQGWSVTVDGSGDAVLTGHFTGTVDFGGGPLTSAGAKDIFLARFGDPLVAVAIRSFDARAFGAGVALHGSFTSNLRVLSVNVYRAEDSSRLLFYKNVSHSGEEFYYEDHDVEPGRTYRYQIGVVDNDGEFLSQVATVKTQSYGVVLLPNSPNPFNPATTIHFTLEKAIHVTLSIYDAKGRRVTMLVDDVRSAGPHQVRWDGTDAAGSSVSSGVYFYRMRAGNTSLSRRMVLLK